VKYKEAAGISLSAVGLGTWQFGSRQWAYGTEYASTVAPEILRRSLDLGVNLVDTAEIYGDGHSERIVGQALGSRRDEAFLATKLYPILPLGVRIAAVLGWPNQVDPIFTGRARGSARRLGVQAIDLYQLHWPNRIVPLSATMAPLARLRSEGLLRHIGVSNYSLAGWKNAEEALEAPVVSNQVRYSLIDRRIEDALLPWAQQNDRFVIAYSPLQSGLLSGRYGPDNLPNGGLRSNSPDFLAENLRRVASLLDVLRRVASAHDAAPAQVALAWLLRRPNVIVIPGASSVAQAESNAAAADLELSDDEDAELTEASDPHQPIPGRASDQSLAVQAASRVAKRVRGIVDGLRMA
jgi:aryl-alcohol dehydrogenase-like predicted oxidoreductase